MPSLPSASRLTRLWRPVKLLSPTLDSALPGYGMLLNGVLMSELTARWGVTVSAATKPPGVMLMPLYLMVAGPSSEEEDCLAAAAVSVATVVLRASLLAFKSPTVVLR